MANKIKHETNVSPKGSLVYPHLKTPDTEFSKGGAGSYCTGLKLSGEDHEKQVAIMQPILDASVAADDEANKKRKAWVRKLPFVADLDDNGDEAGTYTWSYKQNAEATINGEVKKFSVSIIDAATKPIDCNPWGGTIAKIRCTIVPYAFGANKEFGLTLRPNKVQILELVEGSSASNNEGFEEEEGYIGSVSNSLEEGFEAEPDADF